jgi:alpha-1,3-glucosyltransferase
MKEVFCVFLIALTVRYLVSLHPHSGESTPPMYGDYEAQRHWMEITVNVPIDDWYRGETKGNDLKYWGLDYPPLSAYFAYAWGRVAERFEPEMVALTSSRGYETVSSKVFMRVTVLISDVVVYFTGAYLFCSMYCSKTSYKVLLSILLQPALILIDHGHFQYNTVSLGLIIWSIICIQNGLHEFGTCIAVMSVCFKHLSLYFIPGFFFFLLLKVFKQPKADNVQIIGSILGLAVMGCLMLAICFAPLCRYSDSVPSMFSEECKDVLISAVMRLFPFERGLFEDKVANVWCALSVVLRSLRSLPIEMLLQMSLCAVILSLLPVGVLSLSAKKRASTSIDVLLWCLFCSSIGFFLFAYQVHEKQILLPLLPATLLYARGHEHFSSSFGIVAAFSLFPLLRREGLVSAYFACVILYLLSTYFVESIATKKKKPLLFYVSLVSMGLLHVAEYKIEAPKQFPHLYPLLFSVHSCVHFLFFWCYGLRSLYLATRCYGDGVSMMSSSTDVVDLKVKKNK